MTGNIYLFEWRKIFFSLELILQQIHNTCILLNVIELCIFSRSLNEQSCDQMPDIKMSHSDSEVL